MSGNTVGTFFKNRLRSTKLHTYSATGDLVTKDRSGAVIATITIPNYRPPTEAEVATMETDRLERIKVAQEAFEAARRTMRTMVEEGLPSNIRRAMAAVAIADTRLQAARYAARYIDYTIGAYEVREIDMEDPRNTAKTVNPGLVTGKREPIEHYLFRATPFSPQDLFCRVATPEEVAAGAGAATAATTAARTAKKRTVLLISQPTGDTGFMSSWYPSMIRCRGNTYRTAYQAILGELAIVFNEEEAAREIQRTRDVTEISFTLEDAEEATEESWNRELDALLLEVNRDKFGGSPERADLLIGTGSAVLGYVPPEDPTDAFQGIGLDVDNPDAMNFKRWTGQNKFGIALGVVRKELLNARKGTEGAGGATATAATAATVPRTAILKRKPVGAAATAATTAASAVASTVTAAAGAVSRATGAVADSLIDLFNPVPTPATATTVPAAATTVPVEMPVAATVPE
jgi:ribA/ribD-fused uncharacterized protein